MEWVCCSFGRKSRFLPPLPPYHTYSPRPALFPASTVFIRKSPFLSGSSLKPWRWLSFFSLFPPFPPKESPSSQASPLQQRAHTSSWHPCSLPSFVQALVASHLGFCRRQAQCSLSLPLTPLLTLHCLLKSDQTSPPGREVLPDLSPLFLQA